MTGVHEDGQRHRSGTVEVDQSLADHGHCGRVHRASGRRCLLPAHHPKGCVFEALGMATDELPQR